MSLTRYYIVPGNHGTDLQGTDYFYYKADEVRTVLTEAHEIGLLLKGSIELRTHKDALLTDPDYLKAERFLTRLQEIAL